ncbi:DUF6241 domain-containing protein [Jeotgalibacillus campisalis]|uniref:CTP synthase n=1 Tax=Jeotgalibacillus campisalis TaxID=220754 RepID=A0A0C2S1G8_9BACL|nr:DUF6241 domain-containing protein [Jeotgalibacillus campisalis]KIL47889.1 hypothetical protein KR50_20560 [Jeotgalibacillus campisalis]
MSKKVIFFIVTGLIAAGLIGWGSYEWLDREEELQSEDNDRKSTEDEDSITESQAETDEETFTEETRASAAGSITDEDLEQFESEGLNPFKQKVSQDELADFHYQEYIHGMTHQKIKASKKWGFYEIHPKRIDWLLEGLEKTTQINTENKTIYREILTNWRDGNFTQIDKEHNKIWRMQDGTVGEATGILSPEEEQSYIESMAN